MKLSALIYNMCCKMSLESIWIRMHMVKICTKYFEWMWHAIYIFEHVSGTHRDLLIIIGLQMWLSSVYKINSNSPGTLQSKIYQKLLFIDASRKQSNLKKIFRYSG